MKIEVGRVRVSVLEPVFGPDREVAVVAVDFSNAEGDGRDYRRARCGCGSGWVGGDDGDG